VIYKKNLEEAKRNLTVTNKVITVSLMLLQFYKIKAITEKQISTFY